MDRRNHHFRRLGAWTLLVLALVSVLAPAWADSYLCPMVKARQQTRSCCAKSTVMPLPAAVGQAQLQPPCDCPKLSWTANATDQSRNFETHSENAGLLRVEIPYHRFVLDDAGRDHKTQYTPVPRSSPPLWRQNQSILC